MKMLLLLCLLTNLGFAQEDVLKRYSVKKSAPQNLSLAIMNGDQKRINKYITESSNLNYQFEGIIESFFRNSLGIKKKNQTTINGWSPLIFALYQDDEKTINRLLHFKVDVNLATKASLGKTSPLYPEGTNAFHIAFSKSNLELIQRMLSLNGNLLTKNINGQYPFHFFYPKLNSTSSYAALQESLNTLDFIFKTYDKEQINAKIKGEVPFSFRNYYPPNSQVSITFIHTFIDSLAVNWCNFDSPEVTKIMEVVEQNIQKFDLNIQNELGISPIFYALNGLYCSKAAVKWLLDHGANPCLKDHSQKTALDLIYSKYALNTSYRDLFRESEKLLVEAMAERGCLK